MKYILDASAVIAFAKGEKGDDVVAKILCARGSCCIHPVNWIEVHYKVRQWDSEKRADEITLFLRKAGVVVPEVGGEEFWRRISSIKNSFRPLSLADCHAVGLAEWLGGIVVTSDQRISEAEKIVRVRQIR